MDDTNSIIIQMIRENKSVNEIVEKTGLSPKKLYFRLNLLKLKGYEFKMKYYYNGNIVYQLIDDLIFKEQKGTTILTSKDDNEFRAMVISDLHFGNVKQRLDLLNQVYDYCTKMGIHIILNLGDIIDGLNLGCKKNITSFEEQIEYTIKNYPFDKNIINFLCLGNHDYDSLKSTGQNLAVALSSRRHDLVTVGYGTGIINVKNDQIIMRHPTTPTIDNNIFNNKVILSGHSHVAKYTTSTDSSLNINVPSLSDLNLNNGILPGALVVNFKFSGGYICIADVFQLLFSNNKIYKVNEANFNVSRGKDIQSRVINNEEDKKKVLTPNNTKLSQTEKFNRIYNKS